MAQNPKNSPRDPQIAKDLDRLRKGHWRSEAQNLYLALLQTHRYHEATLALQCGRQAYRYRCPSCTHTTDIIISCHLRLCPRCAVRRALKFVASHSSALRSITAPKLLTLTDRSVPTLTPHTITLKQAQFAALRRRDLWRSAVKGGAAALEISWTPAGWHPHIHALIDADYIPRPLLQSAWKQTTKGAWNVDIRECDPAGGIYEVAKYVAKGSTFYKNPEHLDQFIFATKGRRFFTTFGSFYAPLTPNIPPADTHSAGGLALGIGHPPPEASGQPHSQTTEEVLFDNPPPQFTPYPFRCSFCGGPHLSYLGKVEIEPIDTPALQLELKGDS